MNRSGYQRDRFPSLPHDSFECIICCQVVKEPWQCDSCGKMFCKVCITDWMAKQQQATKCPSRCTGSRIAPIKSKALLKLYYDLDVECINPKCKKMVKLIDLEKHEEMCLKVKCWNFDICDKVQDESIKSAKPCCSGTCEIVLKLVQSFGNTRDMYAIVEELFKSQPIAQMPSLSSNKSLSEMAWDSSKIGTGIALTENGGHIFLKEQSYVFRSAVGNIGFTGGKNYWEIIADPKTQNELKIGVTLSKDFDFNSAFCDNNFGYAYYGLGQLRFGSNASGQAYGKRFKKEGVLGVCLNMETGTLSFALNGEYWGPAFTDNKLKKGTIYPAVSLLHCAGCKIRSGMKVPPYFKD